MDNHGLMNNTQWFSSDPFHEIRLWILIHDELYTYLSTDYVYRTEVNYVNQRFQVTRDYSRLRITQSVTLQLARIICAGATFLPANREIFAAIRSRLARRLLNNPTECYLTHERRCTLRFCSRDESSCDWRTRFTSRRNAPGSWSAYRPALAYFIARLARLVDANGEKCRSLFGPAGLSVPAEIRNKKKRE